MHNEVYSISDENIAIIENAVSRNKTICAVGTTTLRCLESAYINQKLLRGEQSTNIFIYPPHNFKIVNALFTNFHTPHSTLLMLVSAFAGREFIFECYDSAINNQYKFFSYGDAMLIL
jgi:S-adenosylmethionine:tRNA ribosyltransferase-isomerase